LYSSLNIVRVIKSRRIRWAGYVACMGEGRGVYRVLVGRSNGKRPLGRPRHRWEDNIMLDLREIWIDGANWIQLAQDQCEVVIQRDQYESKLNYSVNEGKKSKVMLNYFQMLEV
jgi:hypothetical protein